MYAHIQANSSSYSASDMCGSPAIDFGYRDPGLLHKAKLSGLQPGLTYYYTCGDQQFGWSQEFSFRAATPANASATTRVVVYGGRSFLASKRIHLRRRLNYAICCCLCMYIKGNKNINRSNFGFCLLLHMCCASDSNVVCMFPLQIWGTVMLMGRGK